MKSAHCAAWWGGLGEERQVALPRPKRPNASDRRLVEMHRAAWWGGLGEERQVALPPRT